MRHSFSWHLSALLLAGIAAGAQVDNSDQVGQSPSGPPPTDSAIQQSPTSKPEITVTGTVPHEPPLPALPPDEFTDCMQQNGLDNTQRNGGMINPRILIVCEAKLNWQRRIVIDKCINSDGKSTLPMVIQACTESLDHQILQGRDRIYIFSNRAEAYFAAGDTQRALEDYNQSVKLAPQNAKLYYNRGVFYVAQADSAAALRDFDTALSINPTFVAALQQRAKVYLAQANLSGAFADYSVAVRLQPKMAELWSQRGYVLIRQHEFESAINDETEAIRLDPKLARAYFLRGAAFGDLGKSSDAVSDIVTAVGLDPSLDHYISSKGKTASIALPPI